MSPDQRFRDQQTALAETALQAWNLGGVLAVEPLSGGLIHRTYRVLCDRGTFCLQALHPKLAGDDILADWEAVCAHLAAKSLPAPKPIPTGHGRRPWTDFAGRRWRLTTWLEGRTIRQVTSPRHARQAAGLFGRFYQAMRDIPYKFRSIHPLHDTRFHMNALESALERTLPSKTTAGHALGDVPWSEIQKISQRCLKGAARHSLPSDLPVWIVHGDPKISNVLFKADEAVAILDLDTCGPHSILVDLGDALRSWAMAGTEDDCSGLRLDVAEEAMAGWREAGLHLVPRERALLPDAAALISWELAARFTRDIIEDSYFGWDQAKYPSRRAHNLARARSMVSLAGAFEAHHRDLTTMVDHIFSEGGWP